MTSENKLSPTEIKLFCHAVCGACAASGRLSSREVAIVSKALLSAGVQKTELDLARILQRQCQQINEQGADRHTAKAAQAIRETRSPHLAALLHRTLTSIVQLETNVAAGGNLAATLLLDACTAAGLSQPPSRSLPLPPTASRSSPPVTNNWLLPSVAGVAALVAVLFTAWAIRFTFRENQAKADAKLVHAISAAQEWIDGTSKASANDIEQQLIESLAVKNVTRQPDGQAILNRVRTHRDSVADTRRLAEAGQANKLRDKTLELAKERLAAGDLKGATTLVAESLIIPGASASKETPELLLRISAALSRDAPDATASASISTQPSVPPDRHLPLSDNTRELGESRTNQGRRSQLLQEAEKAASLTAEQAEEYVANLSGEVLFFYDLAAPSDDVLEVLAKHDGGLSLYCLTTLSPRTVRALSRHKGPLYLNSVQDITPEVAAVLARHEGFLDLNGLASISDQTASMLANHAHGMRLLGVASLSGNAMADLKANPRIELPRN